MENFNEKDLNQIPALQTLMRLGYTYIPSPNVFKRKVLLEDILRKQLRKLNPISYQKKQYPLSEENVFLAIEKLRILFHSRVSIINEKIYHLITTSQPYTQMIEGNVQHFGLVYIDWRNWENNVYHCTSEPFKKFSRRGVKRDILLYINGIPLAVLPCKLTERDVDLEIMQYEWKSLKDLSSYIQLLFSAKGKGDLLLQAIAKAHYLFKESPDETDDFGQTLKVCEEVSPYIADIIEDNLLD